MEPQLLNISGNIVRILEGRVDSMDMEDIDFSLFDFALGSGSYSGPLGIGETMIIGGKAYVSAVSNGELQTKTGRDLKSPFLMGIAQGEAPAYILENESLISLQTFYENLSLKETRGFAVVGWGRFQKFKSTFLKKAPVYHENVNLHAEEYWEDEEEIANAIALFVGVVIGPDGRDQFPKEQLSKAFYVNPRDKNPSFIMSHTHAAILDLAESPTHVSHYDQLPVKEIRHLLTHSILAKSTLKIFPISKIIV